jgi:mutator protein MutT
VPAVGAVVVTDAGVVLVRRKNEPLAGRWSLPGGGVEVGETLAACVVREVREETGLDVEVGPVIEVLDRIHEDEQRRVVYHYVLIDYVCRPVGGTLAPGSDASDVVVAAPEDLERYGIAHQTRDVILKGLALASAPRPEP